MFHVNNLKPRSLRPTPHLLFCSLTYLYINSYLDKPGRKKKKKDCSVSYPKGITMSMVLKEFLCHSRGAPLLLGNPALATSKLPAKSHYLQHRKPDGNESSWIQQKVLCRVVRGKENNQSKWHDWWINLKTEGHAISPLHSAQVKKRSYKNSGN